MTELEGTPQPAEQRSAGRTIARNTLFGVGAQFSLRIVSFLFQILVVRQLGGEQFGQYSIVLAWAGIFSVIGDIGISQYLAREIARDHKKASELFWDVVTLRLILAVAASVVTTTTAILNEQPAPILHAIFLYTLTYFLQAFLAPLYSILNGNERVDILSIFEVVGQVIFMAAGGFFLLSGFDFIWLVIASFLNLPVLIGLSLWVMRRNPFGPPRFHVTPSNWGRLLRAGLPFGFIQLSLSLNFRVDTLILDAVKIPTQVVGWYNAAYGLSRSFIILSSAFNAAILPTLAREHATKPESIRPWYYRSVQMMMFVGLPVAVGGSVLADKIITTLYGAEYAPASIAFMIIIWDLPIVMYTSFCGNLTTAVKRELGAARIYGSLGAINLVLNLIFIPSFGMIGASFATVISDLVSAAQFYFLFKEEFGTGLGLRKLLRIAASAIMMGIVIFLLRDLDLFVLIAIGIPVYFFFSWLTGAFTKDERLQLVQIARRLIVRTA